MPIGEPQRSRIRGAIVLGRTGLAISLMFLNVLQIAVMGLLFRRRRSHANHLRDQARFAGRNLSILRTICGLDVRVEGRDSMTAPPYVILSNHQSTFETLTFQAIFPPFVWVLKESLVNFPVIGHGLRLLRPIAIDRGRPVQAVKRVLADGEGHLRDGISVLLFPEGTRFEPGAAGRYSAGGIALAKKAGVAILPVVHDAGRFWSPDETTIRPGTVTIRIGEPIPAATVRDKSRSELIGHVADQVEILSTRRVTQPGSAPSSAAGPEDGR